MGIVWEFHEEIDSIFGGGGMAPFFTCDRCGKKIENGYGIIVWETFPPAEKTYEEGEVQSTGRYWLLGIQEQGHRQCHTSETEGKPWDHLATFLLQAAHNCGIDLKAAEAREQRGP